MTENEKIQLEIISSLESLVDCSGRLLLLRKDGTDKNNCEALSESVASVQFELNRLVHHLGYSEDVKWWFEKKVERENETSD